MRTHLLSPGLSLSASLAVSGLLLCSSPALAAWPTLDEPPAATGGGEKDAAVVVAIEDYLIVPDVTGARANGLAWARWLERTRKVPFVATIFDQAAAAEDMEAAAKKAAARVQPGGTLWFVFIGHGAPSRDQKDGLLVGMDARQSESGIYSRSLARRRLEAAVAGGKQARTVLVLDSCFSGRTRSGKALGQGLQPMLPVALEASTAAGGSPITVLTAGLSSEFAGALPKTSRPAFTYLLLGALRGWGDADADGNVTLAEAVGFARETLAAKVHGRNQTPQLYGPGGAWIAATGAREQPPGGRRAVALIANPDTADAPAAPVAPGMPKLPDVSFSELTIELLNLLKAAAAANDDPKVSSDTKIALWKKVAKYKRSKNPYAKHAKQAMKYWRKLERANEKTAENIDEVARRYKRDIEKLQILLEMKGAVLSEADKEKAQAEFDREYAPWLAAIKRTRIGAAATDAAAFYKQGRELMVKGDYKGAERAFKSAAGKGFARAYKMLGAVYMRSGDKARAIKAFKAYLSRSPGARDASAVRDIITRLGGTY